MFERFTEPARQVVVLAQDEARALKHDNIGSEHLLLGLLRDEDTTAGRALAELGITVEEVRAQVARIVGQGDEVTTGQIPFTPRAKKILELGVTVARERGDKVIGPEHILLGIARENEGVASRILLDFDADAERIVTQVELELAHPPGKSRDPLPAPDDDEAERLVAEIRRIRAEKEVALEARNFERAAKLRDDERRAGAKLGMRRRLLSLPAWQYRIEPWASGALDLNTLGAQNWELVAIVRGQAIFKRRA
jgi:hypothetical protein